MALELLDHSPTLYPLYSDMENSDTENKLMIPSPIPRQKNVRSPTSRMSRNHNYYRNVQRRSNKRRLRNNSMNFPKHLPKSLSLDTISFTTLPVNRDHPDTEFIYNLTKSINDYKNNTNKKTHSHSNYHDTKKNRKYQQKKRQKRRQKRRIRTFYSKKWGNKLYGLTTNFPIITPQKAEQREIERDQERIQNQTQNNMSLWKSEVSNARRALSAFIEEETLDLNDIKSPRSVSMSPMINNDRLNIDFRLNENINYDSNVSNMAATTDIDDEHDDNKQNFADLNGPSHSNFKIIVSAPNHLNQLHSEMIPSPKRTTYIPSDIDSAASDDPSTSSDDDDGVDYDDHRNINKHKSLFLGGNNMNVGVYSCFPYSDQSETDYLSAQSDDFDELTICYHNARNIRFRNRENDNTYLSDIGPSDIGSSDTECFSSADSIPDSIPPQTDFVSIPSESGFIMQ